MHLCTRKHLFLSNIEGHFKREVGRFPEKLSRMYGMYSLGLPVRTQG